MAEVPTSQEVQPNTPPILKPEWYKQYIKASGHWPVSTFGRAIYVGASVMEYPPESLAGLSEAVLSDEQALDFIKLMKKSHTASKINSFFYQPINAQIFWLPYKDTTQSYLDRILQLSPAQDIPRNLQTRDERLEILFQDPNSESYSFVKRVLLSARQALSSPQALEISGQVRHNYSSGKPYANTQLTPALRGIVGKELKEFDQQREGLSLDLLIELQIRL